MQILHIAHQYSPEHVGGTELYTQWLASSLHRRGHKVSVFYRRDAEGQGLERRHDPTGVTVYAAWSGRVTPWQRFRATWGEGHLESAFGQVLDQTQPHLVHVQHLMGLPINLVHQVEENEVPFIITLHDFWWRCANANLLTNYSQQVCNGPWAYLNCTRCALARAGHPQLWPATPFLVGLLAWRNHLLKRAVGKAARLITPTEFVRQWYVAHGAPVEKLIVVPPGLEPPARLERKIQQTEGPLRFAYLGGLTRQKGVHILLQAFQGLAEKAELWIAGDGSTDPDYVTRLRTQAAPHVRFLGRLSRGAVWETLAQVDVIVVPSICYETFSFNVSEAFSAGVPVVASRLGALADRVHHKVDGLLVPPGDQQALNEALAELIDNPTLLAQLRAGVRPARTMDEHAAEIESLYQSVVAAR